MATTRSGLLISMLQNTGAIDVKMGGGSYIISIVKTASKKIGALIPSMKFLSSEVALYLYKSTIWPCMEYCSHVWAGGPSCYFHFLLVPLPFS